MGGLIRWTKILFDNYVWFIVVGVILFMALIGYIAEKQIDEQFEKKVRAEVKRKRIKNKAKG